MLQKKNSRRRFTPAEDERLISLVNEYGFNWKVIAKVLDCDITSRQCRERFKYHIDPNINKSEWTIEEENLIRELVDKYGKKWSMFTAHFDHRPDCSIKNHYAAMVYNEKKLKRPLKNDKKRSRSSKKPESLNLVDDLPVEQTENNPKEGIDELLVSSYSGEFNIDGNYVSYESMFDEISSILDESFNIM